MSDPFKVPTPAFIQFSGGRSSAYMLWRIIQAYGDAWPSDLYVTFANTGKEMPQTLNFVRDVGDRWTVPVIWLEYADADLPKDRWRQVTYETASRNGEPFWELIIRRQYLPNPVARFCTQDLKIRAIDRWANAQGIPEAARIVGLRADEPSRVSRLRARQESGKDGQDIYMPLATAGITKENVQEFWQKSNFDLGLPSRNGRTPLGNCDLCFLKGKSVLVEIMRRNPDLADWWIRAEAEAKSSAPAGSRFRKDRPGYAELFARSKRPVARLEDNESEPDEIVDCFCGDGA